MSGSFLFRQWKKEQKTVAAPIFSPSLHEQIVNAVQNFVYTACIERVQLKIVCKPAINIDRFNA
jgi:hypothetical protein